MTTLDTANQIPASINTLERMATWVLSALGRIHPNLKYLETDTAAVKVVDANIISDATGEDRLIVRISIPLDADWNSNGLPLWQSAKEIENIQLPTNFESDPS